MPTPEDLAARIESLEIRIAHQDQAIEDLNRTITGQWKLLDGLTRQLANLREQVKDVEAGIGGGPPEPPPPHY